MTKEELEKEAREYVSKYQGWGWTPHEGSAVYYAMLNSYIDSAEPREKRIEELEVTNKKISYECHKLVDSLEKKQKEVVDLEKENAELRKVAEFQQSSNINKYFENKKLKEGLAVGSTFNKALNSMNKTLEEERDKYRNMVFDKDEQLTKAKEHIKKLLDCLKQDTNDPQTNYYVVQYMTQAEQFLKDSEVEK